MTALCFAALIIFIGIIQIFGVISGITLAFVFALKCFSLGIGLIIYYFKLTKETRKARKAVIKAAQKLPSRSCETFSDERKVNFS